MIPDIGLMVGAYIVTRMVEIMAGESKVGKSVTRILAALTVLVAVVCLADLLLRGTMNLNLGDVQ